MLECSGCENGRVLCKLKERAPSSTVEESLQQTSIARSGSPHNALHSLDSIRLLTDHFYSWMHGRIS